MTDHVYLVYTFIEYICVVRALISTIQFVRLGVIVKVIQFFCNSSAWFGQQRGGVGIRSSDPRQYGYIDVFFCAHASFDDALACAGSW